MKDPFGSIITSVDCKIIDMKIETTDMLGREKPDPKQTYSNNKYTYEYEVKSKIITSILIILIIIVIFLIFYI